MIDKRPSNDEIVTLTKRNRKAKHLFKTIVRVINSCEGCEAGAFCHSVFDQFAFNDLMGCTNRIFKCVDQTKLIADFDDLPNDIEDDATNL